MTFPAGTEAYRADAPPITARGVQFSGEELDDAANAVAQVLWDDEAKAELAELLASVASTEFAVDAIDDVLRSDERTVEEWRAGEAVAQTHLEANVQCFFPWNSRRDLKNPSASPAGAELVGFDRSHSPSRLAVGEVKTSEQEDRPPSVVYGTHGLQQQLISTRDEEHVCQNLLRWLGMRALEASWEDEYRAAAARFLQASDDISLFGVLVRTVDPDPTDLKSTAEALAADTQAPTSVTLEALYVQPDWLADVASDPGEDAK